MAHFRCLHVTQLRDIEVIVQEKLADPEAPESEKATLTKIQDILYSTEVRQSGAVLFFEIYALTLGLHVRQIVNRKVSRSRKPSWSARRVEGSRMRPSKHLANRNKTHFGAPLELVHFLSPCCDLPPSTFTSPSSLYQVFSISPLSPLVFLYQRNPLYHNVRSQAKRASNLMDKRMLFE